MPANPAAPEVMTVAELATLLRKGQRQTREALKRDEIPGAHKIGNSWRISAVVIRRWLHGEESNDGKEVRHDDVGRNRREQVLEVVG